MAAERAGTDLIEYLNIEIEQLKGFIFRPADTTERLFAFGAGADKVPTALRLHNGRHAY
jgi:hypothetical protein